MFQGWGKGLLAGATAVTILSCLASPLFGQSRPNIRSTTSYTLKPDRVGDFAGAVKEYDALLKKAGYDKGYTTRVRVTGPVEYRVVSYNSKWTEFDVTRNDDPKLKDVQVELTAIGRRIMSCVEKYERVIMQVNTALSLPRQAGQPKMIQGVQIRVHPDKVDDYLALLKSDMFPAIQKSEIKTFAVAQARFGAPPYELRITLGMDNRADLDGTSPVVKDRRTGALQRIPEEGAADDVIRPVRHLTVCAGIELPSLTVQQARPERGVYTKGSIDDLLGKGIAGHSGF